MVAYSIVITVLNGRWITRRFRSVNFGSSRYAVRCLRSLQQSPLKLSTQPSLFASLVVLPQNDKFWKQLAERLDDQASTWTVASATSVLWVLVAYTLNLVLSFLSLVSHSFLEGQAIGSGASALSFCVMNYILTR